MEDVNPMSHAQIYTCSYLQVELMSFSFFCGATGFAAAVAEGKPFFIGLNNSRDRTDYRESVASWITESGATLVDLEKNPFQFSELQSFWGLHLRNIEQYSQFTRHQTINSFPGLRQLFGDKDALVNLQRQAVYELGVDASDFSLPGYVMPRDSVAFQANSQPKQIFVKKLLNSHSGAGISLVLAENVPSSPSNDDDRVFVLQEYVNPLLVMHRKFDVRWWVVLTAVHPKTKGFILNNGYVKLAHAVYHHSAAAADRSRCGHITNGAVQRNCFCAPSVCNDDISLMHVRGAGFQREISPFSAEDLFLGAKNEVEKLLHAASWKMSLAYQQSGMRARGFQFLALDVIYNQKDGRARLLEVNLNGYLQSGLLKVPHAKERVINMLHSVHFLPSASQGLCLEPEYDAANVHPDWVALFKSGD